MDCSSFSFYVEEVPYCSSPDSTSFEDMARGGGHPNDPFDFPTGTWLHEKAAGARWMGGSSFSSGASSSRSRSSDGVSSGAGSGWGDASVALSDAVAVSSRVLGTGQFGEVRECTDHASGESLAVKTIRKSGADLRNVRMEVDVMRRLEGGDGVVQLRRVVEDSDSVHLVMDLCEGGDLFDEVVRRERFSEPDAAHVFAELAKAVCFCHSRGVVHRDLKPENALLTRRLDSHVPLSQQAIHGSLTKLADFGLAASIDPGKPVRGVAGSPFYIAPEVLKGEEYNSKADVWSLGVILYVLLSGTHPFWGDTDALVFDAIRRDAPDLDSWPWDEVSEDAKDLLRSMLCKDPRKRPSSGEVLRHPWLSGHWVLQ